MNPDTRMALSLVLSLLVSAENLRMAAAGEADIVSVGLRYVIGFVLIFLVVGAVGRVFNAYLDAVDAARNEHQSDSRGAGEPGMQAPASG